ncbi:MAG: 3-phosphoshikimate 1-carboxyvinyltransferase [Deltaproteobacteria bacterium]|nr:3-phosphoshikimate 1-carboxyvinyltransferase [Deltaproteobacteria bacterium]
MKSITIKKTQSLKGEITVPGDKSISHRAIMLGSIAEGDTTIKGLLKGEDNMATLKAFRQMGIRIDEHENGIVAIQGKGLHGLKEPEDFIDAGNSGTTMRLLTGLLSGQKFFSVLTGDQYLRKRPMKRVVEPLNLMGAKIFGREDGNKAPLAIVGSKLKGMTYNSPVASAQIKSAILMAGLYADGVTTVIEPTISRDHTERMLAYFGADVKRNGATVSIKGGQKLVGKKIEVPGDISSAAFFMVAALITKDSELLIKNAGINPTRTGIIDILQAMGGDLKIANQREISGEPVGDILIKSSRLKGIEIKGDIIPRAIDELPVIAVAAAFADGITTIKDAKELKVKETDRIESMTSELRKIGVKVTPLQDGMTIEGGKKPIGNDSCTSWGDHRVAMSMIVAGLAVEKGITVSNTDCIDTSFPGFVKTLSGLGCAVSESQE